MVACSTARSQAGLAPIIFAAPAHHFPQSLVFAAQRALLHGVLQGQQARGRG